MAWRASGRPRRLTARSDRARAETGLASVNRWTALTTGSPARYQIPHSAHRQEALRRRRVSREATYRTDVRERLRLLVLGPARMRQRDGQRRARGPASAPSSGGPALRVRRRSRGRADPLPRSRPGASGPSRSPRSAPAAQRRSSGASWAPEAGARSSTRRCSSTRSISPASRGPSTACSRTSTCFSERLTAHRVGAGPLRSPGSNGGLGGAVATEFDATRA